MNLPHLGINDIGVQKLGHAGKCWLVHEFCPKRPKTSAEKWHLISFDCYSRPEIAHCETCGRRFGRKALAEIKIRTELKVEFSNLEQMRKFAAENKDKAFHAHVAFQPLQ